MLLGEAPPELPSLVASEVEAETVWLVAKEQSKYWKSINIKGCEPSEGLKVCPSFFLILNSLSQNSRHSYLTFQVRVLRALFFLINEFLRRDPQSA